ncbi:MAG: ribonuclease HI family protein [Patescibacteria group bacterium]|nr:ribonuclease HI family protein [Patescibacteria group bacterium]
MKKITIYTDGASRGNPGPAGAGIVFENEKGQPFKEYAHFLGKKLTNNEAEYLAVIFALKKFKHLFGKKMAKTSEVELKSDSELLVKQLTGKYKLSNKRIQEFFIEIWNLRLDFKKMKFVHISRNKNKKADALANQALDQKAKAQKLF